MQSGTSISVLHVRSATAESTGISRPAYAVYGIQYIKVDIRTNKPLNGHFRFRLSCGYATGTDHRFVMLENSNAYC